MTGGLLAQLIVDLVSAVNNGSVPNIEKLWDILMKREITHLYETVLNNHKIKVGSFNSVTEQEDLVSSLCQAKYESLMAYGNYHTHHQGFLKNSQYGNIYQEYRNKLLAEIRKIEDRIRLLNSDKCNSHNADCLKKLYIRVRRV
jgi:hypothetical protein